MKIQYPEFEWNPLTEWNLRFVATTTYWSLDVAYCRGEDHWRANVNQRGVDSGGGTHGYEFASEAEAKAAAVAEVHRRINEAVDKAVENLQMYCPELLA